MFLPCARIRFGSAVLLCSQQESQTHQWNAGAAAAVVALAVAVACACNGIRSQRNRIHGGSGPARRTAIGHFVRVVRLVHNQLHVVHIGHLVVRQHRQSSAFGAAAAAAAPLPAPSVRRVGGGQQQRRVRPVRAATVAPGRPQSGQQAAGAAVRAAQLPERPGAGRRQPPDQAVRVSAQHQRQTVERVLVVRQVRAHRFMGGAVRCIASQAEIPTADTHISMGVITFAMPIVEFARMLSECMCEIVLCVGHLMHCWQHK